MFGLGRREFGNPKNTVESLLYKKNGSCWRDTRLSLTPLTTSILVRLCWSWQLALQPSVAVHVQLDLLQTFRTPLACNDRPLQCKLLIITAQPFAISAYKSAYKTLSMCYDLHLLLCKYAHIQTQHCKCIMD